MCVVVLNKSLSPLLLVRQILLLGHSPLWEDNSYWTILFLNDQSKYPPLPPLITVVPHGSSRYFVISNPVTLPMDGCARVVDSGPFGPLSH